MQHFPNTKFEQDGKVAFPYRQLIGSLTYMMVATRPDLAFSLSKLSKLNNSPRCAHWEAACDKQLTLGYFTRARHRYKFKGSATQHLHVTSTTARLKAVMCS